MEVGVSIDVGDRRCARLAGCCCTWQYHREWPAAEGRSLLAVLSAVRAAGCSRLQRSSTLVLKAALCILWGLATSVALVVLLGQMLPGSCAWKVRHHQRPGGLCLNDGGASVR